MDRQISMGLHLVGTSVRRAHLRRTGGRFEVLGLDEVAIPATAPSGETTVSADHVPGGNGRNLTDDALGIAAMPAHDVISRTWMLPATGPARLSQIVAHRIEADIPIPPEELAWGYRAAEAQEAVGVDRTLSVRVQAVRRDRLSRHLGQLESAGLAVDTLTTESDGLAALARIGLEPGLTTGLQALILAADDAWLVAVFVDDGVRGLRHIAVDPGRLAAACQECRQTIEAHGPLSSLRRVFWTAPETIAGGRDMLEERLGVPVEPVRPGPNLVGPAGEPIDARDLGRYGTAIGLALAGLLDRDRLVRFGGREQEAVEPGEKRLTWIVAHPIRWGVAAAGLALLALVIHLWAITAENGRMKALLAQYDPTRSPMTALEPKIRAMARIDTYRIDAETVVAHLCARIPNGITLTSIQLTRENGLAVKGTAGDPKDVFKWADDLRADALFADVRPGRTEPGRGGSFTMTADVPGIQKLSAVRGGGDRWR